MIRKYHNHLQHTNPRDRKEEPQNIYSNKTSVRQQKQSNQLSLPLQDDSKLERTQSNAYQNKDKYRAPTNNGKYISNRLKTTEQPP